MVCIIYILRCLAGVQEISIKASSWHDKIWPQRRMPGSVWPSSQEVLIGSGKDFDGACLDIKADNSQDMLLIVIGIALGSKSR